MMADVKVEASEFSCCFCFQQNHLYSMLEPHDCEEGSRVYATMIAECFGIEIINMIREIHKKLYMICESCITRLRDALRFKFEVQDAYDRIQDIVSRETMSSETCTIRIDIKSEKEYFDTEPIVKVEIESGNEFCSDPEYSNYQSGEMVQVRYPVDGLGSISLEKRHRRRTIRGSKMEKLTCDTCEKTYNSKYTLKQHLLSHTYSGRKCHPCNLCGTSFTYKHDLTKHLLLHTGGLKYRCEVCDRAFTSNWKKERHARCHDIKEKFICDYCDESFRLKSNLAIHVMKHMRSGMLGKYDHHCRKCLESFRTKREQRTHEDSHKRKFVCIYCGISYKENVGLEKHMEKHVEKGYFRCDLCQKKFRSVNDLQMHLIVHKNGKNFKCDHCDKSFVRTASLKRHALLHARNVS